MSKHMNELELDKAAINEICDVFSMDEALAIFNKRVKAHTDKAVIEELKSLARARWQQPIPERLILDRIRELQEGKMK